MQDDVAESPVEPRSIRSANRLFRAFPRHAASHLDFGTTDQADVGFGVVISLCGRSDAATRSHSGLARSGAECQRSCPARVSKPDAVLSRVSGDDRRDAGCHAPPAVVGEGGMAVVSHATLGDRHQSRRELWIAGSVYPSVPKGLWRLAEPLSAHGRDVHLPPRP